MDKFINIEHECIYQFLSDGFESFMIDDDPSAVLNQELRIMEETKNITFWRVIYNRRKVIGKWIVRIEKIVRRCFKFLVEPQMEQQARFNNAVTMMTKEIYLASQSEKELVRRIDELEEKNKLLFSKIIAMEQELSKRHNHE